MAKTFISNSLMTLSFRFPIICMRTFCFNAIALVLVLSAPLASYASEESLPSNNQKPLRIALFEKMQPYSFKLPNGKVTGLYADIWRAWSEKSGIPVEFKLGNFHQIEEWLLSGEVDFHGGLNKTKKRQEWAVFSHPIDQSDSALFFDSERYNLPKINEMSGYRVGVGSGSSQEHYLQTNHPEIEILSYQNIEPVLEDILEGTIDAFFIDIPHMRAHASKMGLLGAFKTDGEVIFSQTAHALIPNSNQSLKLMLDKGIKQLNFEEMAELEKKWIPGELHYYKSISPHGFNELTIEEQEWVKTNSEFLIGVDPYGPPFEYIDQDGTYSGISAAFSKIISEKLGVKFKLSNSDSWQQVIEKVQKKEIDVMPGVVATEERLKYLNFSQPYMDFSSAVITRYDAKYVQSMDDLDSKKVAIVESYFLHEIVKKNHPKIKIVPVQSINEGLEALSQGQAFAYIDNLETVTFDRKHNFINDYKLAFFTPYKIELSIGVRKGLEALVPILDKAIADISEQNKRNILNDWMSSNIDEGVDLRTIANWLIPLFLLVFFYLYIMAKANKKLQIEIRERRKAEMSANLANKRKGEFLANMSHEIRTPMNAVIGTSNLLKETKLDEQQNGYLNILSFSAKTLLSLINDILDLSKIEAGKLKLENTPFNLKEVVENIINQLEINIENKNVRLQWSIEKRIPVELIGDASRLAQVLLNLCQNAIKFTEQGVINLEVSYKKIIDDKLILVFSISDTGIGMTEQQMSQLFSSYNQADTSTTRIYGGTGLGLAISKNLVEMMGGEIWAESEKEKGSRFSFTAAYKFEYEQKIMEKKNSGLSLNQIYSKRLKGKQILLVEDNIVNVTIAKRLLENVGTNVHVASNGKMALQIIQAFHENGKMFDCVLMDIQMPVMDGYEATKHIRKSSNYGNIPILALSANVLDADIERGRQVGMDTHIAKPIEQKILFQAIEKFTC